MPKGALMWISLLESHHGPSCVLEGLSAPFPSSLSYCALSGDIRARKSVPKDMLDLAKHIIKTKTGHFKPDEFEDRYEDALKDLLRKKDKGEKIEPPKEPRSDNVVNLMDALRRSVQGDRGHASHARRRRPTHHRKSEHSASRHRKAG